MIRRITQPFKTDPYDRPNDKFQKIQITVEDQSSFDAENQLQVNNLRFSRRKFTFAVTAFILGAITILIESPARNEFLAPGPLTSHHAQLLAGQGAERCAACHDSGNQSPSQWLSRAFSKANNAAACQSDLCMKCHEKTINVDFATKPHNQDPKQLEKRSEKFKLASFSNGFSPPIDHKGDIECGTCHKEHHGNVDLKVLTDRQCQTCHSQKYYSFENDHPDFASWPQKKRQRIAFDHVSHFYKHYPGKEQIFDCQACHVDDQFQSVKLLAGYEQTCAQCHEKDIEGASEEGLPLVSIPMLDLDAINDLALNLGEWPTGATGDFDGKIPELMRLLLFKDQKARKILESRGQDFEFCDFDPDNPRDVKDAVDLAWATKNLVYDLATEGKIEIRKRIEFALQRTISETDYLALTNGINAEAFATAANVWLPNLANEIPAYRATQPDLAGLYHSQKPLGYFSDEDPGLLVENPLKELLATKPGIGLADPDQKSDALDRDLSNDENPTVETKSPEKTVPEQASEGNWLTNEIEDDVPLDQESSVNKGLSQSEEMMTKKNQLVAPPNIPEEELLAKNPIASMELGSRQSQQESSEYSQSASVEENPVNRNRESKISNNNRLVIEQENNSLPIQKKPAIPESELLAENPLSRINIINPDPEQIVNTNDKNKVATPLTENSKLVEQEQQIAKEFIEQFEKAKQTGLTNSGSFEIEQGNDEKYVGNHGSGGWFRNDQLFQISYRINGHADQFVKTVMDVVAETSGTNENPATSPFFGRMTSQSAIGACTQCHTVDEKENSTYHMNWKTRYRDPLYRDFTRFSHRPHLTQPQLRDCSACHALNQENTNSHTFKHFDSSDVLSNFNAITKANCTSCHFKGSTNSGCTQCHNYHVGSRVLVSQ